MKKNLMSKITVILRGYNYKQIECIAEILSDSIIRNIEITLNSPNAFESILKIKNNFPKLNIGAGSVCTLEDALQSIKQKVDFILSPIKLSKEIIDICKVNKVVCVPSAMTPSEVYEMFKFGADIVKIFPATTVGPKFFKDIQAPFGDLDLMAVGGVNLENAKEFLNNNCKYLGIGSGLFNKNDIETMNKVNLKLSLNDFIENVEL
ncbi:MAG: bifunctional 4-hydroxy-2-oxoglutarate aldolase/2-dehydro-3-deoxy-phosphogluconate aldolase [Peptoniphilaceae bacterium]|nr:bifunctional 4-hydroxy-2-oxoglutarate aldolase/2-dehydro-3-deoxy-phosphogluconate aldolase [Peptoniphilaceae bacterium]MDD7382896.1 bifunctional 4-hydroxy-2-oxoglutarate aldolase/2-dehydro-3-deoxy-phosphogluconate aldolase [Peptoniphilaceae bacterium]MDY3737647.1 bifunctional 4-hydroxy-2-oxoglutarate aldolase/2-dehydro-3-deoxy-phosphogluconate aldolase [Peptoniphilaceae bacterium]